MTKKNLLLALAAAVAIGCSPFVDHSKQERESATLVHGTDEVEVVDSLAPDAPGGVREPTAVHHRAVRCGAQSPIPLPDFVPSDCSLSMTHVSAEYEPHDLLRIPTVVHVVSMVAGTGDIDDALVRSQVDVLNEDFRARSGSLGENGVDTRIEFSLVTVTPDGHPTTGIERYASNTWYFDPGPGVVSEMKQAIGWDPDRYFNIYINDGGGLLGYSTFPQDNAGTELDGVVLDWHHVGRHAPTGGRYDQGRTGTHEVGHYLGLFHTFQNGCGTAGAPYASGDLLADTAGQQDPTLGCPGQAPSSCGSADPVGNYMNYTDDACMTGFTLEQANRMRCSLIHYRPDLPIIVPGEGPFADFSWAAKGARLQFSDHSVGHQGELVSWHWDFGDGTTSTQPAPDHVFPTSANYTIALTVLDSDGAQDTQTHIVQVGERPTATFSHVRSRLQVAYNDDSSDPDSAIVAWHWDFGDGVSSTERHPVHHYASPGTYVTRLTAIDEGGLRDTRANYVTVDLAAQVDFSADVAGLQARFTDLSLDDMGELTRWYWDFGDGTTTTSQHPDHDYTVSGTYTVSLTVTNDLDVEATARQSLVLDALPRAEFAHSTSGLLATFNNLSEDPNGDIVSYNWSFGDGNSSTEASPKHEYAQPGSYQVTLSVTDGFDQTASVEATIRVAEGACSCRIGQASPTSPPGPVWALLLLGGLAVLRRRRGIGQPRIPSASADLKRYRARTATKGKALLLGILVATLAACSSRSPTGSSAPATSPPRPTHGVMLGDVASDRVTLWSRTDQSATMHVHLQEVGQPASQHRTEVEVEAASDFTGIVQVDGLQPDRQYDYAVWFHGSGSQAPDGRSMPSHALRGTVRTAPARDQGKAVRFAWGGDLAGQNMCRDVERGFAIFDHIDPAHLDFFIALGDMVYADNACTTQGRYGNQQIAGLEPAVEMEGFWSHWRYAREDPGYRAFLGRVPSLAVWDDHEVINDFGPAHDTGNQPPYRAGDHLLPKGLQAWLDYNPIQRATDDPRRLYRSIRWGRHLELFFLDTRQYRAANSAPDTGETAKSLLGAEQRAWLLRELATTDATWTVIVSSVPMSIPTGWPAASGRDGWANHGQDTGFERELTAILRHMQRVGIRNSIWLTTDVHFASGFRYTPFADAPDFQTYEWVSGPLNAGLFPKRAFDTSLGAERLFFYGPESAEAVTNYQQALTWMNAGFIDVDESGALTVSLMNGHGETVFRRQLQPQ